MPIGTHGAIWVSDSGKPYKAKTRYRDADGVVREVARFGQTKTAARNGLLEALRDRTLGAGLAGITGDTLVRDLADVWLTDGASSGDWSIGTVETYTYIVNKQIKPQFGAIRLRELRPALINRNIEQIVAASGPSAAKTTKTALSGICQLAIQNEALEMNPLRDAKRISRGERKDGPRALTVRATEDLCDRLRSDRVAVSFDLPDLVEFMLGTGCRIGEACAARDEALTFTEEDGLREGIWEVNATVVRKTGTGLVLQRRTKTDAGWRVLALPPFAVAMLDRRRGEASLGGPEGVVFGSPRAHALRDKSNTTGRLREALDRAGFDWVTSHTFRKTVATRMDEAGCSARQIADQLGHAKPSMTMDVYMGRKVVSSEAARILDR